MQTVDITVDLSAPEGEEMDREPPPEEAPVDPLAKPLARMRAEESGLTEIEEAFETLDKDGDKKITRSEFKKGIAKLKLYQPKGAADGWKDDAFDKFDVTGDGEIGALIKMPSSHVASRVEADLLSCHFPQIMTSSASPLG